MSINIFRRASVRPGAAVAVCVSLLAIAVSCGKMPQEEVEEMAGQQSFNLDVTADKAINSYGGVASSLTVCVYQLNDRKAYDSLRDDPDALAVLLACEKFDASVVGRERLFFDPGETRKVNMERRRGARYLLIAAGYYRAGFSDAVTVIELPPVKLGRRKPRPPTFTLKLGCDSMAREKKRRGLFGGYE